VRGGRSCPVFARLADPKGRALTDDIENGVRLFMWKRDFDLHGARLELLDAGNDLTRTARCVEAAELARALGRRPVSAR
jgi:hypothetical protein